MEIGWGLAGNWLEIVWKLAGDWLEISWRLVGDYLGLIRSNMFRELVELSQKFANEQWCAMTITNKGSMLDLKSSLDESMVVRDFETIPESVS